MNNIDIEKMKREIKVKVGGTVVFCGLLFTLMGCGKTVVDTTVEQQPTQTVETTVDDPVVDVPVVEPTTDVSGNDVEPVEEHDFSDATFVQTGDNSYTIYVDCQDNSNAPEIEMLMTMDRGGTIKGVSEMMGISENLLISVMAHGLQIDPSKPAEIDYNAWKDKPIDVNFYPIGNLSYVLTDDPSAYENVWGYPETDLNYNNDYESFNEVCQVCSYYLKDCLKHTNGNLTLALARYHIGPDAFDAEMQRFKDEKGLTDDEIYAHFNAADVLSSSEQGLEAANYATEVLSYITPEDEIVITTINSNGHYGAVNTYVVTIPKRYGSF